jgi:hypothetical protein
VIIAHHRRFSNGFCREGCASSGLFVQHKPRLMLQGETAGRAAFRVAIYSIDPYYPLYQSVNDARNQRSTALQM